MNIKIKKIIAREFLYLVLTFTIGLLGFAVTYLYNGSTKSKIENIKGQIANLTIFADSLKIPFQTKYEKQNWFYENYINTFQTSDYTDTQSKFWDRLVELVNKDSVKTKWTNAWHTDLIEFNKKVGFNTPEEFISFIQDNTYTTKEAQNYEKGNELIKEIEVLTATKILTQKKILHFNDQINISVYSLIAALILLFGVRHFFNALKWSLKTIKQADTQA